MNPHHLADGIAEERAHRQAFPVDESVWDDSHVWGRYRERMLTERTIIREIFVFPGGKTSVHRHARSTELNFVLGGSIRVLAGLDPDRLEERVLRPGDSLELGPGFYHAVAFEASEDYCDQSCARYLEIVVDAAVEDIERFAAAIPGDSAAARSLRTPAGSPSVLEPSVGDRAD